jgi:hypothetical protein
VAPLE